jgi:hypothetical protein
LLAKAFDRIIHLRNQIYTPDHLVILDASLLKAGTGTAGDGLPAG